jgi:hypothetical protein
MENFIEKGPEQILSKEEVLEAISRYAENAEIVRELSDENGLYLLEAKILGEKPGEITQFEYMRKGTFPNHNESVETAIHKVFYENEIPVGGESVAVFKPETGEWIHA